ncbi:hypothetical protein [Pseudomonas fluorescens]|uniref:Uncharacterized protein n=1 Tax=Pseudomonas fluorescens TaxID=294 RepID=A0A5E7ECQ8_PSEFL|nr:hypothetical protein [Pseudomonas fluorescens]VVO24540.1 hypothetical protein PS723_04489 [Pseudomonas fluorescens]
MVVDDILAMGDMMRACFVFKRFIEDSVTASRSYRPLVISTQRAQEMQAATDLLRQALSVLEPKIQVILVRAQQAEAPGSSS